MTNSFAQELAGRIESRFVRDSSNLSYTDWVREHTTINGRQFSVKGYEFQEAILNDMHPNLDVIKCSQVGLTEVQIRKILAFVYRNRGVAAIFTLPEEKLFKRVSQTRIQPILKRDKVFNMEADQDAVRSMGIVQIGLSFLYITGCTEGDATSTSADAVFNDEVDLSDQNMLALFNSRLQNSLMRISQRFSTPTFPMFGIDLTYQSSDKHQYLCQCPACGHHNVPAFNRNFIEIPGLPSYIDDLTEIDQAVKDELDLLNAHVVCEKCRSPLELGNPEYREWVAEYPNRKDARGYRVTPFCTDRLDVAYIVNQLVKYKSRQYLRGFYNTVLGLPYADGNMQLSIEDIRRAFTQQRGTPEIGSDRPMVLGIDMGQTCHLVMGDASGGDILLFKSVHIDDLLNEVEQLLKSYNIVAGGVDRNPYTPTSNALRDMSDGRIVPIEYSTAGAKFQLVEDKVSETLTHVKANRTAVLDDVAGSVRGGRLRMSGYSHHQQVIEEHLRDMWRDEQPEKPAKWVKLTGKDHFFHAIGYYRAAIEIQQVIKASEDHEERSLFMPVAVMTGEGESQSLFSFKRRT